MSVGLRWTRKVRLATRVAVYSSIVLSLVVILHAVAVLNRRTVQHSVPSFRSSVDIQRKEQFKTQINTGQQFNANMCHNISTKIKRHIERDIVHKKSIFYCGITKVASTFTDDLLRRIPKCKEPGVCFNSDDGYQGPPNEDTFSFMWVREPYSRLFSAFENKLFTPNDFWKKLGKPIIQRGRQKPSEKSVMLGYDVTFAELVQDVIQLTASGSEINNHLRPMNEICDPCTVPFDFVGRLESFTDDVGRVCDTFRRIRILDGMDMTSSCDDILPENMLFSRVSKLFDILKQYSSNLTKADKIYIMNRTWRSYQIRGVLSKNIKLPYTEKNVDKVKMADFKKLLNDSIAASQNASELKAQRREALVQAYMSLPRKLMNMLRDFVKRDCLLFGYELEPDHLFQSRDVYKPSFDYFGGLM